MNQPYHLSAEYEAVHAHIVSLMPRIERPPSRFFSKPYLVVSAGTNYSGNLFVWDHYHMALRFAADGRPDYLLHLCENVLDHQEPDGFTPNCILKDRGPRGSESRFHAQPFLARAAWAYLVNTNDVERVEKLFDGLAAYLDYYESKHRAPNGLHRWAWPFHSGFDNDPVTTFHLPDTIVSCDLSSFLVLEFQAMAAMAKLFRADQAINWSARGEAVAENVRRNLWMEDEQTFASWDLVEGCHRLALEGGRPGAPPGGYAYQSCSNLIPLYAGIASAEQAAAMIGRYVLDPAHFWSPWGIRSLSRSSEFYNNAIWGNPPRYGNHQRPTNSNWQGPVWVPLCFFMNRALKRYGFHAAARQIEAATCRVLSRSLETVGSFAENFCAETGAPLYARDFAAWNLLGDVFNRDIPGEFA